MVSKRKPGKSHVKVLKLTKETVKDLSTNEVKKRRGGAKPVGVGNKGKSNDAC